MLQETFFAFVLSIVEYKNQRHYWLFCLTGLLYVLTVSYLITLKLVQESCTRKKYSTTKLLDVQLSCARTCRTGLLY